MDKMNRSFDLKKDEINILSINPHKIFLYLVVLFSFFSGTLDTSVPAFILISIYIFFNFPQINFSPLQILFLLLFLTYFLLLVITTVDTLSTLKDVKWFYGIIIFLILLKSNKAMVTIDKVLSSMNFFLLLVFFIIMEAFLVNTFLNPASLYGEEYTAYTYSYLIYNRPLGPSGNPSMTATIIIALFAYLNPSSKKMSLLGFSTLTIAITTLMSTTGFALYILYFILRSIRPNFNFNFSLYSILILLGGIIFFSFILINLDFQKLSFEYFYNVLVEKIYFLETLTKSKDGTELFTVSQYNNLFGHTLINFVPLNGGDFAWLDLIYAHGIIGFLIFIGIIISFFRNENYFNTIPIVILLIGAFHYGAIFNSGGQLLLSYLVLKKDIVR